MPRRKIEIWKLSLICIILLLSFIVKNTVYAEEAIGFSVSPIFSEHQIDSDLGYFYLRTEPATAQELKITVKSLREEPTTIKVHVNDAVTNDNVSVEYSNDNPKLDTSLENPLSRLISIEEEEKEITVSNYEERIVTLTLAVPKDPFTGIKLGGIRFIEQPAKEDKAKGLTNRYGYTVGVMVTQDNEPFNEGADLKMKEVGATLSRGMKVVYATLQNPEPKLLGNLNMEATVYKKGEKKPLLTENQKKLSVAPNSTFSYYIPWGLKDLKAGWYEIHLTATSGEREWKWIESFEIGAKEAAKINSQALNRLTLNIGMKIGIVCLGLLTSALALYRVIEMKKEG
ncbi:TPA: DUF916 and DUF3324 domain-containing protein [Enterococcus faecium]